MLVPSALRAPAPVNLGVRLSSNSRQSKFVMPLANTLQALIDAYQSALLSGLPASPSESTLYAAHDASLQKLKALLTEAGNQQAIAELLAHERRGFGWSFLSGTHGKIVEEAFNALASALEQSQTNA